MWIDADNRRRTLPAAVFSRLRCGQRPLVCSAYGIRTRVSALRGQYPQTAHGPLGQYPTSRFAPFRPIFSRYARHRRDERSAQILSLQQRIFARHAIRRMAHLPLERVGGCFVVARLLGEMRGEGAAQIVAAAAGVIFGGIAAMIVGAW